ncbi:unnamed protein product [Schistosoma curassoni]|uniref:Reverse transcriptase domain-containing protein n=1 Tax=Schistosoma curassoni TaxID=6186 RepID=A0A183KKT6_9TREM|nr:unnamed protein product [Schistosoma curassoni]
MNVTAPTIEEIRMQAIRQIKSGKAVGPENIPAEAIKPDIQVTANMLHVLFRKIWEEEHMMTEWKDEYLIKMPKKGDLSKYENYRGITLQSVPGKVSSSVAEQVKKFSGRSALGSTDRIP